MLIKYAVALLLGPVLAQAGPAKIGSTCGTYISKADLVAAEAHFQANNITPNGVSRHTCALNVYWHVIARDETLSGGYIPKSQITANIDVINKAYTNMGIKFNLAGIDRTINPTWFRVGGTNSSGQHEMKNTLRKGGVADLNVYTVGSIGGTGGARLLGYSTFPFRYKDAPKNDGVVILYNTLPGGTHEPFNLGHILTHETGHWVGLYHTFEGDDGCDGPGDYVSDTPAEDSPATGCPVGRDTCPGDGPDPIQNFMDYSDDSCMTEFTPGQAARARAQMATYRGVKL